MWGRTRAHLASVEGLREQPRGEGEPPHYTLGGLEFRARLIAEADLHAPRNPELELERCGVREATGGLTCR